MSTNSSSRNSDAWALIKQKGLETQKKACANGNCNVELIENWYGKDCSDTFRQHCIKGLVTQKKTCANGGCNLALIKQWRSRDCADDFWQHCMYGLLSELSKDEQIIAVLRSDRGACPRATYTASKALHLTK